MLQYHDNRERINTTKEDSMAVILAVDGALKEINDLSLEVMQEAVGGFIEIVPTTTGQLLVLDEDGRRKGKAVNVEASKLYGDYIVGDVILADNNEID